MSYSQAPDPNPYLRWLTLFAYIGMVLGVILGFVGGLLLMVGITLFALGFLSLLGYYVASAISWNAGAIAYAKTEPVDSA